jgi:large subunit ribosomal protein L22
MVSSATARFQRISTRKARVIINLVRGRSAAEALQLLDFVPKSGAAVVKKLLASAVANARVLKPDLDIDTLFVSKATADKGPLGPMRRWRPRAMGRASRIDKGVSHLHIELDER